MSGWAALNNDQTVLDHPLPRPLKSAKLTAQYIFFAEVGFDAPIDYIVTTVTGIYPKIIR